MHNDFLVRIVAHKGDDSEVLSYILCNWQEMESFVAVLQRVNILEKHGRVFKYDNMTFSVDETELILEVHVNELEF